MKQQIFVCEYVVLFPFQQIDSMKMAFQKRGPGRRRKYEIDPEKGEINMFPLNSVRILEATTTGPAKLTIFRRFISLSDYLVFQIYN